MSDRLDLERRELRNMAIAVGITVLALLFALDGPLPVRLVVAAVLGCLSAAVFLFVNAVLDRLLPTR